MAHPNVEKFQNAMSGGLDPSVLGELLAPNVVWYEAGNPEPFRGREAVLARMEGFPGDAPPVIETDAVLGDDDNLVVVGRAHFVRGTETLDYRYVEFYRLVDGRVAERRSFMDAVPEDVATFFGS
jgi:ketosteroid isomerase-like protein